MANHLLSIFGRYLTTRTRTTVGGISIRSTALGKSSKILAHSKPHLHYTLLVHSLILTYLFIESHLFEIFDEIKLEVIVSSAFLIQNQAKRVKSVM
jgi:hypothetical protein